MLTFSAALILGLIQAAVPPQPAPQTGQPTATAAATQAVDPILELPNSPTPADPKELLEVGRRVNGLDGADVKPWHLKATYEVFEDDGTSRDKGTLEEWWVSDKQVKITYTAKHLALTQYVTDQGTFRVGDPSQQTGAESRVQGLLTDSSLRFVTKPKQTLSVKDQKIGPLTLRCLVSVYRTTQPDGSVQQQEELFCFDVNRPILRFTAAGDSGSEEDVVRDQIVLYRNRYLARDIKVTWLGKTYLKVHQEIIEPLNQLDEAFMQPPQNAVRVFAARKLPPSDADVDPPQVLHAVAPVYPLQAQSAKAEGTVRVQGVVGIDGRVTQLIALDGPSLLRQAAIKAVAQYVFKPAMQAGQPVPAEINIAVNFRIYSR